MTNDELKKVEALVTDARKLGGCEVAISFKEAYLDRLKETSYVDLSLNDTFDLLDNVVAKFLADKATSITSNVLDK